MVSIDEIAMRATLYALPFLPNLRDSHARISHIVLTRLNFETLHALHPHQPHSHLSPPLHNIFSRSSNLPTQQVHTTTTMSSPNPTDLSDEPRNYMYTDLPGELRNHIYAELIPLKRRALILPQPIELAPDHAEPDFTPISIVPLANNIRGLCEDARKEYLPLFVPLVLDLDMTHITAIVEDLDFETLRNDFMRSLSATGRTRVQNGTMEVRLAITEKFCEYRIEDRRQTSLYRWVQYRDGLHLHGGAVPLTYTLRDEDVEERWLENGELHFFIETYHQGIYGDVNSTEMRAIHACFDAILRRRAEVEVAEKAGRKRVEVLVDQDKEEERIRARGWWARIRGQERENGYESEESLEDVLLDRAYEENLRRQEEESRVGEDVDSGSDESEDGDFEGGEIEVDDMNMSSLEGYTDEELSSPEI